MELVPAYNDILIRYVLYLLIFWPTVGYYVYVKSKEQGFSNPQVRGVALGFLGILGLIIHLWNVQRHSSS